MACFAALQLAPGCLGLIAPDCRSWGAPARGSSWRTPINVLGVGYPFVVDGNCMASRKLGHAPKHACVHLCCRVLLIHSDQVDAQAMQQLRVTLVCLLVLSMHAFFIVEQPRASLLFNYFRWQWLQQRICWVTLHACITCIKHTCMHILTVADLPRYMNAVFG